MFPEATWPLIAQECQDAALDVFKKHRYSAFFDIELGTILREWGTDTVRRRLMTTNLGYGAMPNAEVHHATLVALACSTALVITVAEMKSHIVMASLSAPRATPTG